MVEACSRPTACSPSTTRNTCPRKLQTRSRSRGIGKSTGTRAPVPIRKGGRSDALPAMIAIAELGHYALVLALALALVQSCVPIYGARRNDPVLMSVAAPVAIAQFGFVVFAFGALV